MRTGKNKSGPDPGAKCEMLAKNPDEPSVRKFEMRNVSLSRRVAISDPGQDLDDEMMYCGIYMYKYF